MPTHCLLSFCRYKNYKVNWTSLTIMKIIKFLANGKMLPKCSPISDVIANWYLKSSTRVEIFGSSSETILEYSSNLGTRMHP